MRFSHCFSLLLAALLGATAVPAMAADGTAGAGNVADSKAADSRPGAGNDSTSQDAAAFVELAEAYRSGFFELCWSSVFEIYDASVKAAGGFSSGKLSSAEAQDALTSPGLLLSTVYTGLVRIDELTAAGDSASRQEIADLQALLKAQDELNLALLDWFGQPGEQTEKTALQRKAALEDLLAASQSGAEEQSGN